MAFAVYAQRTGEFAIFEIDDGGNERCLYECKGYAGRRNGRNNHLAQELKGVGPLPVGFYRVAVRHHGRFRAPAFALEPFTTNTMFGRSGFWIHGDNATNDASSGCIILERRHRDAVLALGVSQLEVQAG